MLLFSHFLLNYNKDFEAFGTEGAAIFKDHQSKLELDNINLLYVALTRAVEQLYIVGNAAVAKNGAENLKTYSGLLINYLKSSGRWKDGKLEYELGKLQSIETPKPAKYPTVYQSKFISTPKAHLNVSMATNAGYLWDTVQKEAHGTKGQVLLYSYKKSHPKPIYGVVSPRQVYVRE